MKISYLLILLLSAACVAEPPVWTPEMAAKLKLVGQVAPSPDGQWVAYTQTESVISDTESHELTHIYLARADGSQRFQLTRGTKSCGAPAWAPDGKFLYFTSERSGKNNLWRIPVAVGEAEQLTEWKGSLGAFLPSPDGKLIALTARAEDKALEKRKKEKNDPEVVDADPQNHGIWVVPVNTDDAGKREPVEVVKPHFHVLNMSWTPDGESLVFEHQPTPGADDWTRADISAVTVASKQVRPVATSNAAESSPKVSPDGRWVAFTRSADPPRWMSDSRIVIAPLDGGSTRELARTRDERPLLAGWTADSRQLIFSESWHTRGGVYLMPLDAPPSEIYFPPTGIARAAAVNPTGTHVGFAYEDSVTPREAFVMAVGVNKPIQVSASTDDVALYPMPRTELIRWKGKDGKDMEGLLTFPVNYQPGTRYPMVLNIHGGPAGVFAETFVGSPSIYPLAAFAGRGYAVLRPNPRGSGGYGKDFRVANVNDWGGGDYEDIMAGVDKVIEMGVADAERLSVMGWSYGGFMTSWVVTQTQRFDAAVVGAGVTNLWSFTGTADIPGFLPDYFQGEPWEAFENYRSHSPITFAHRVKTPTLVLHGEADVRVPLSQGQEFYRALKSAGVITRMVVYPRTPHGPREPKFVIDIANRHLDWVDKYVK